MDRAKVPPAAVGIELFELINGVPSVTLSEYRLYEFLANRYWPEVRARAEAGTAPFSLRRAAGGLLLAEWNGAPDVRRRTIFVCHTDREGYVIDDGSLARTRQLLRAEQPYAGTIEESRFNAAVEIAFGIAKGECRLGGRTLGPEEMEREGLDRRDNTVWIRVEGASPSALARLEEAIARGWPDVVACHTFGVTGQLGTRREGDLIEAACVDNAVGVAVCTAVLSHLLIARTELNVSVLYTTGEEGGFLGALAVCCEREWDWAAEDEDVLFCVVDGSDVRKSWLVSLDAWLAARKAGFATGQWPDVRPVERGIWWQLPCPMEVASVRLEDRASVFDPSVARMLYQAAVTVRNQLVASDEESRKRPAEAERVRSGQLGSSGVFVGGVCEASILTHMRDIRRTMGLREPGSDVRVGSIALPMQNYRYLASGGIEPEITTIGTMNSAYLMSMEACKLHNDYWYGCGPRGGYRGGAGYSDLTGGATDVPTGREELVQMWCRRYEDRRERARKGLDMWWESLGGATS